MTELKTDLKKKTFSCFLKILSPVHIGCDEVYEPTGFVVDEKTRELVIFDPFAFFGEMSAEDREKFTQICRKGTVSSILEIYKFLRGKEAKGRRVPLCSDFLSHYDQTLSLVNESDIQNELRDFRIQRTAFHPHTGLACIPGSSIKGALRTAYLNAVAKSKKHLTTTSHKKLEEYLLDTDKAEKKIESDPFRLVKVSDFMPVRNVETRIVYAVNEKKGSGSNWLIMCCPNKDHS
ncbi:MAG: type III-A CRISPR-associated RAMP protein Csm5 [Desulfococcaceae bacterium]